MKSVRDSIYGNRRGFTLIELMVVVIVIGILSAVATIGYKSYMDQARVTRLKSYVISLASKQTDAMSRQVAVPFREGAYDNNTTKAAYRNILGFDEQVYPDVTVETEAWTPSTGGRCTSCAAYGVPAPTATTGFFAVAAQDMVPGGARTVVYMTNETATPIELNVGE